MRCKTDDCPYIEDGECTLTTCYATDPDGLRECEDFQERQADRTRALKAGSAMSEMTKEEALELLDTLEDHVLENWSPPYQEALRMAMSVLRISIPRIISMEEAMGIEPHTAI